MHTNITFNVLVLVLYEHQESGQEERRNFYDQEYEQEGYAKEGYEYR